MEEASRTSTLSEPTAQNTLTTSQSARGVHGGEGTILKRDIARWQTERLTAMRHPRNQMAARGTVPPFRCANSLSPRPSLRAHARNPETRIVDGGYDTTHAQALERCALAGCERACPSQLDMSHVLRNVLKLCPPKGQQRIKRVFSPVSRTPQTYTRRLEQCGSSAWPRCHLDGCANG